MKIPEKISSLSLALVVISSCIGTGIFFTPPEIARYVPSEKWILFLWVAGLVYALSGAMVCGKLAKWMPDCAGIPFYLEKAYGNRIAFLYGWTYLLFLVPGTLAAFVIALTGFMFPGQELWFNKIFGIAIILIAGAVNVAGLIPGNLLSYALGWIKIAGLVLLIVSGFVFGEHEIDFGRALFSEASPLTVNIGLAFVGVAFSFSGLQYGTFLTTSTNGVEKNIFKTYLTAMLIVGCLYVMANISYFKILGLDGLKYTGKIDETLMLHSQLIGDATQSMIVISVLGTLSAMILAAPRMFYELAARNVFPAFLKRSSPFPERSFIAILCVCLLSCIWVLFYDTFYTLLFYLAVAESIFMSMTASTLFVISYRNGYGLNIREKMLAVFNTGVSFTIVVILIFSNPLTLLVTLGVFTTGWIFTMLPSPLKGK